MLLAVLLRDLERRELLAQSLDFLLRLPDLRIKLLLETRHGQSHKPVDAFM